MSKRILLLSFMCTALLLVGLVLNIQLILLAVTGLLCALIFFLNIKDATYLLFYISPFSYILMYQQYNLYILPVVMFILMALIKRKSTVGVLFAPLLMVYCMAFSDSSNSIKLGQLISPILLLLIWFVCQVTEKEDYPKLVSYFTLGFVGSACIGFFKNHIPLLQKILVTDSLYINGMDLSEKITRYSGISYDPNFFALVDSILIAILLLQKRKMNLLRAVVLIFLTVVGFFTFSKSYVLLLALIFMVFAFENSRRPFKTMMIIGVVFGCLAMIDYFSGIQILALVQARFTAADNVNDLTTGRAELWLEYLDYILSNVYCLFFGSGFNALSLRKAVHNTYIDSLYRFGMVGTLLWIFYLWYCKKEVAQKNKGKTASVLPAVVLLLGVFFLSAFHFQQFWCCIFLAMICPYLNGEEPNEKIECHCSHL